MYLWGQTEADLTFPNSVYKQDMPIGYIQVLARALHNGYLFTVEYLLFNTKWWLTQRIILLVQHD